MSDKELKGIQEDVDKMTKALGDPEGGVEGTDAPGTDAPGTKAPGTDAPSTDAPGTSAPSTDAPKTDAPKTEAPATEAPTTDAPETDEERLDRIEEENKKLREKVEGLSSSTDAPGTTAPATEAPIEEHDFIGDANLDDLTRDPKEFNKLLNRVYSLGVKSSRELTSGAAEALPGVVETTIQTQTILKTAIDNFYDTNEDLKPFKKVVATVYSEEVEKDPKKKLTDVLADVAIETRNRLELKEPKVKPKPKPKPKLPRKIGSSQRRVDDKPTGVESELDDMNEALTQT